MKQLLLFFSLMGGTFTLSAQILNVEEVRKEDDSKKDWLGQLDFKLAVNNRNSTPEEQSIFTQFGITSNITLLKERTAYILIGDVNYNSLGGDAFISTGYIHYRNHFAYKKRLSWEQYNQWQYDAGRGLRNRWLTGGGARYEIFEEKDMTLALGTGLMLEYEAWEGEENVVEKTLPKSSSYVRFTSTINKNVTLALTNYYQVGYDWEDEITRNRISTDFTFSFKISENLLFTTSFVSTYEDEPIIPLTKFIFQVENGLRIKF